MMRRVKHDISVPIISYDYPSLVMVHCDQTLLTFIEDKMQIQDISFLSSIMRYILSEISRKCMLLSTLNIVHADLHLGNLLVKKAFYEDCFPIIYFGDWGMSADYIEFDEDRLYEKQSAEKALDENRGDWMDYLVNYFRKPFREDNEYDWIFFLNSLFTCYPCFIFSSFFSMKTFEQIDFYTKKYYLDDWRMGGTFYQKNITHKDKAQHTTISEPCQTSQVDQSSPIIC